MPLNIHLAEHPRAAHLATDAVLVVQPRDMRDRTPLAHPPRLRGVRRAGRG